MIVNCTFAGQLQVWITWLALHEKLRSMPAVYMHDRCMEGRIDWPDCQKMCMWVCTVVGQVQVVINWPVLQEKLKPMWVVYTQDRCRDRCTGLNIKRSVWHYDLYICRTSAVVITWPVLQGKLRSMWAVYTQDRYRLDGLVWTSGKVYDCMTCTFARQVQVYGDQVSCTSGKVKVNVSYLCTR